VVSVTGTGRDRQSGRERPAGACGRPAPFEKAFERNSLHRQPSRAFA